MEATAAFLARGLDPLTAGCSHLLCWVSYTITSSSGCNPLPSSLRHQGKNSQLETHDFCCRSCSETAYAFLPCSFHCVNSVCTLDYVARYPASHTRQPLLNHDVHHACSQSLPCHNTSRALSRPPSHLHQLTACRVASENRIVLVSCHSRAGFSQLLIDDCFICP